MGWYYSKRLHLYVSMDPLKISGSVLEAAKKEKIALNWDDNGFVTNLTLREAKSLAGALNGCLLTPSEYWTVWAEAKEEQREDVMEALESSEYAEFLDRVYIGDGEYIDHPTMVDDFTCEGDVINNQPIIGRPGWIYREEIDLNTGHPYVTHEKTKDPKLMKYWSPDREAALSGIVFPIRGYVTSVDAISLDLGIPTDARQPKLMMRLCKKDITSFDAFNEEENIRRENAIYEKGKKIVMSGCGDTGALKDRSYLKIQQLKDYILSCHSRLREALEKEKDIIFTMGHRNPDSDTVISSVFESWRQHLQNTDSGKVYLPLIQSSKMPAEIRKILGDEISNACIYEDEVPIDRLMNSGHFQVMYTDQNYQKEYQKYLIAMTDHHALNLKVSPNGVRIPRCLHLVGSTASLIAAKLLGEGYTLDRDLCKILYSAMLMDTENRVEHKMTEWDEHVMDRFKIMSVVKQDDELYEALMKELLLEKDCTVLFSRDYKKFSGFGFSELKVCGFLQRETYLADLKILKQLAQEENKKYHYLFTLLKFTHYKENGLAVEQEHMYPVFRENVPREVKRKVYELLKIVAQHTFPDSSVSIEKDMVAIRGVGKQLSRKVIAPIMEQLVAVLDQYVYVPDLRKYVSRDFLKYEDLPKDKREGIHVDGKGRISDLSFCEAKRILENTDMQMLSLKEYWCVLEYAVRENDVDLYDSMTNEHFLEYLDTVCMDGKLISHPVIEEGMCIGQLQSANIIKADPGLINPSEIDKTTGLPAVVHSPAEYNDKKLWRYWAPKSDGTYVFSRSFIFLIGQKCLDAKMSLEESCVNLGIRPVKTHYEIPDIHFMEVNENGKKSMRICIRQE
ncbi:MAG: hypothetical protein ACI4F4_08040 [Lachnospiraceae bacterium]